ncbi:sensor histidine kinase [Aeromonas enteropelogenes]|uniref:histidine kinase n=1 Tax=Aeromonas enteropelogenes TaxID=29489 RepID=A0A175VMF6_AEREN|nr:ATP-binding protein [Aeromonas enteropelogenes]KXU81448.1 PAS domain-containing sensor histidine kinase [Aeromonas enteropelogenes]MBL0520019.1 PAS domain-containing protein [Aeromonas enteropelogenes]UBH51074.1 PAS domain-containing protein [Aeromonas enteropelogenes]
MTILQQDMPLQSHEVSQLYAIFTALPTGVLLLDGAGVITRANPAALSLLGEPLEGELWRQVIARCFEPREDDGHEISLRDGRRVQLSTQPLPDQPGQLVFINDLTETRKLQDRVNHMKRLSALGNMAASLAHQIRTPLSAAMLYGANLANRTLKPESRSQFQQKLMDRLKDLEKQINDILLFARNGDNQVVTPISVQGLMAEVQAGAEAFCLQQGCELHIQAPEPDLCLLANSNALSGAINNLIANAQQAGADSLLVSAVRSGTRVEMRVIDNGKGIPSHQLGQVFEPFFTTRSQGTGLGLAVVQSVVRAHQGEVSVASVPGEGTCFTLSFPLHQQSVPLGGVA